MMPAASVKLPTEVGILKARSAGSLARPRHTASSTTITTKTQRHSLLQTTEGRTVREVERRHASHVQRIPAGGARKVKGASCHVQKAADDKGDDGELESGADLVEPPFPGKAPVGGKRHELTRRHEKRSLSSVVCD